MHDRLTIEAYAKVNLTLEVYGRRADGFHELRSLVLPIALGDTLEIEPTADGTICSDTGYGEQDLVVRAARALRAASAPAGASLGARVHVVKRIPAGGGLGGGSADAAATLRALNVCWGLGRSVEELAALGARIGSDVPALVLAQETGGPVWMEGRGERVRAAEASQIPPFPFLVLVHPGVASSTAEVYARCTPRTTPPAGAVNDLQAAACAGHPEIATALAALVAVGAQRVMMSGSGSVVYGFAPDAASAQAMAARMRALGCSAWVTSVRESAKNGKIRGLGLSSASWEGAAGRQRAARPAPSASPGARQAMPQS